MIEFLPLATAVVGFLQPLIVKALEKGAEEAGKLAVTGITGKLKTLLKRAGAEEALDDLSKQPADADTQGALRRQLVKAMEADPTLAEQVSNWLTAAKPQAAALGIVQTANTQGDHNTVIQVTGSGNTIGV